MYALIQMQAHVHVLYYVNEDCIWILNGFDVDGFPSPFFVCFCCNLIILIPFLFKFQRHNTLEHGGRMSRSQRSAALQACLSF